MYSYFQYWIRSFIKQAKASVEVKNTIMLFAAARKLRTCNNKSISKVLSMINAST